MRDDLVFCVRPFEWQVRLNGEVLPTIWNCRGAALAGLATERRRAAAKQHDSPTPHRQEPTS